VGAHTRNNAFRGERSMKNWARGCAENSRETTISVISGAFEKKKPRRAGESEEKEKVNRRKSRFGQRGGEKTFWERKNQKNMGFSQEGG